MFMLLMIFKPCMVFVYSWIIYYIHSSPSFLSNHITPPYSSTMIKFLLFVWSFHCSLSPKGCTNSLFLKIHAFQHIIHLNWILDIMFTPSSFFRLKKNTSIAHKFRFYLLVVHRALLFFVLYLSFSRIIF